jgi:hypothetical protein
MIRVHPSFHGASCAGRHARLRSAKFAFGDDFSLSAGLKGADVDVDHDGQSAAPAPAALFAA